MQEGRQEGEERIGEVILKLEASTDERGRRSPTHTVEDAILPYRLLWYEFFEPCHRRCRMVGHGMSMPMREDDQIAFAELHWPLTSFDGEPARSSGDDVGARHLPVRHTEPP